MHNSNIEPRKTNIRSNLIGIMCGELRYEKREERDMGEGTKERFREQIIEMLKKIEDVDILEYVYKMVADIMKEDKLNE